MSIKEDLYSKVSCCFAKEMYGLYLQKRFGINNCKLYDLDDIYKVARLKDLFKFKTGIQPVDYLDKYNPITDECEDICKMSTIIEKINLL